MHRIRERTHWRGGSSTAVKLLFCSDLGRGFSMNVIYRSVYFFVRWPGAHFVDSETIRWADLRKLTLCFFWLKFDSFVLKSTVRICFLVKFEFFKTLLKMWIQFIFKIEFSNFLESKHIEIKWHCAFFCQLSLYYVHVFFLNIWNNHKKLLSVIFNRFLGIFFNYSISQKLSRDCMIKK